MNPPAAAPEHVPPGGWPEHLATPAGKPRARSLGLSLPGRPGRWNAITDVPGVEVGYRTLIEGGSVRTGVTAIHPRGRAGAGDPVTAGVHAQNGNGEMTGTAWIAESGTFAGPVAITNTHAIGAAHTGVVAWTAQRHPQAAAAWLLPVVAETYDGYLNDINGLAVTPDLVREALDAAAAGPAEEGSVGGGTGMNCYGFKGGSGTASRIVPFGGDDWTVGVFLQANFGSREELTVTGIPAGRLLRADDPMARFLSAPPGAGSVIAVVATDAPLLPGQCQALARRVTTGLARTGTAGSHFSGDIFLAFSTGNPGAFPAGAAALDPDAGASYASLRFIGWPFLDPFFTAVVEATEEAVLNALVANEDMTGRDGNRSLALPRDQLAALIADERGSAG
jgi:L-aminopeptidase/D-esterase-like protein